MSYFNPLNVDLKWCSDESCPENHQAFRKGHHLGHLYAKRAINASLYLLAIIASVCLLLAATQLVSFGTSKLTAMILTGGSAALLLTAALVYSGCLGISKCARESKSKMPHGYMRASNTEQPRFADEMKRHFPESAAFWDTYFPINPKCPRHGDQAQQGFAYKVPPEALKQN